jgi:hypothetical protein
VPVTGKRASAFTKSDFGVTAKGHVGGLQIGLNGPVFAVLPKSRRFMVVNFKTNFTMADIQLTAYNVKTKEKGVPIQDAVVTKTAKGAYMVQGHDGKGNKLTTLCNEEKALAAIQAGIAKQGW